MKCLLIRLALLGVLTTPGMAQADTSLAKELFAPGIAAFDAPADWTRHSVGGYHFSTPPGWTAVAEKDTALLMFHGDVAVPNGASAGIWFEDKPGLVAGDRTTVLSQEDVRMGNGAAFLRVEMERNNQSTVKTHSVSYISSQKNARGLYAWIGISVMNQPFEDSRAVLENILGTVEFPDEIPALSPKGAAPAKVAEPSVAARLEGPLVEVDVQGVSFLMPDGWNTIFDSPSDRIFESPDGDSALLAFWWFPDEPLTGYEGDIAERQVMIDNEPVTQITSRVGGRISVLNVTDRARADNKRFIFTVESGAMSPEALQAFNDALVAQLRLQPGFDPSR